LVNSPRLRETLSLEGPHGIQDNDGRRTIMSAKLRPTDAEELKTLLIAVSEGRVSPDEAAEVISTTPAPPWQRELYQTVTESAVDQISIINREFQFEYLNIAAAKSFQQTPNDIVGIGLEDVLTEAVAKPTRQLLVKLFETKAAVQHIIEHPSDEGSRWMDTLFMPLPDGEHGVRAAMIVSRDITERHLMTQVLAESEQRYSAVVDSIPDMLFRVTKEGKIVDFVPAAVDGQKPIIPPEAFLGKLLTDVLPQDVGPALNEVVLRVIATQQSETYEYELDYPDDPDDDSDGQARSAPKAFEGRGVPCGPSEALWYARDVTIERKAEAESRQAQKMQALGTLAGGIAHDFNNILQAIAGHTDLAILAIARDHRAQKWLERVAVAANRASKMVGKILQFSRRRETPLKPVDLQVVVSEALSLLGPSVPSTVAIHSTLGGDVRRVIGDETEIHQVVINLCTNACHAMRDTGGVLTLTLSEVNATASTQPEIFELKPGTYIRLTVTDTGHGMDKKTVSQIFDPFFTTKPTGQGTGMGLAMVYGIVTGANGKIQVESELGKGTTFDVYFPVAPAKELSESLASNVAEAASGDAGILLVDDDEAVADFMSTALELAGYRVTTYTSSVEALERFEFNPQDFDLIITDAVMPSLSGIELTKRVLKTRPDMPVILCTGHSELVDETEAFKLGFSEFLRKPVRHNELAVAAERALTLAAP
jgi:PAS domain S-box-containing protein